jgi:hypothetical protein
MVVIPTLDREGMNAVAEAGEILFRRSGLVWEDARNNEGLSLVLPEEGGYPAELVDGFPYGVIAQRVDCPALKGRGIAGILFTYGGEEYRALWGLSGNWKL